MKNLSELIRLERFCFKHNSSRTEIYCTKRAFHSQASNMAAIPIHCCRCLYFLRNHSIFEIHGETNKNSHYTRSTDGWLKVSSCDNLQFKQVFEI